MLLFFFPEMDPDNTTSRPTHLSVENHPGYMTMTSRPTARIKSAVSDGNESSNTNPNQRKLVMFISINLTLYYSHMADDNRLPDLLFCIYTSYSEWCLKVFATDKIRCAFWLKSDLPLLVIFSVHVERIKW